MTAISTTIEQQLQHSIIGAIGLSRFEMWFSDAQFGVRDNDVTIVVQNQFSANWIESNFWNEIKAICCSLIKKLRHIFICSADAPEKMPVTQIEIVRQKTKLVDTHGNCVASKLGTQKQLHVPKIGSPRVQPFRFGDLLVQSKTLRDTAQISQQEAYRNRAICQKTPQNVNAVIIEAAKKKLSNTAKPTVHQAANRNNKSSVIIAPIAAAVPTKSVPGKQFFAGIDIPESKTEPKADPNIIANKNSRAKSNIKPIASHTDTNQCQTQVLRDATNRNVVAMSNKKNAKQSRHDNRPSTTFERFIIGTSNRLAARAAELAVKYPGKINPIYIFGPTSVGKTHLLESIKMSLRHDPRAKQPLMMTAEQFTSAFIEGLKQGMPLFRNKFRGISTLLIDDIQFFAGKDSTQTEFLRTLDMLKEQGVQIVLTGDRAIGALADILKPEIVSRLEAGMHCEIKPAEYETLLAIFKQMAIARDINLSDEICQFVVSNLTTHARQLSGAINRLHAMILSTNRGITIEMAKTALEDLIRNNRRPVRLQDIEKAVCETFQLSGQSLQSKSRAKQISQPRMLAMWLARKYTRSALSEIGNYFGNRTHSTVVSAQKKINQWLQDEPDIELTDAVSLTEAVQKIERMLQTS